MKTGISACLLVCLFAGTSGAIGYRGEDGNFGVRGGMIGSGTVTINSDVDYHQKSGFSLGAFYDIQAKDQLYWGISGDIHRMHWLRNGVKFDEGLLLEFNMAFKYNLPVGAGLTVLRPFAGVGAAHLSEFGEGILRLKSSRYLTFRFGSELIVYANDNYGFMTEASVFLAPSGRDEVNSIQIKPLLLIRAGLVF